MDAVLLDTTVASLLHPKKRRVALREWYRPHLQDKALTLCFHTVAELWGWAAENRWNQKERRGLERFLRKFIIVPFDMDMAQMWALVSAHCKKRGRRLEAGDAWIVACALHRRLPLVTHDRDQLNLGLPDLTIVSALATGTSP
jgi:predicted nucleic acid-binding protein